jgi:hypothetical protein
MRRITYSNRWPVVRKPAWFGARTIKALIFVTALITTAIALLVLVISVSADGFRTDDQIESSAGKSYFFQYIFHKQEDGHPARR